MRNDSTVYVALYHRELGPWLLTRLCVGMGSKLKKLGTVIGREGICSVLKTPEFSSNALRVILLHETLSAEESLKRLGPLLEKISEVSHVTLEVKHAGVPTGVEILPKNVGKATAVEEVCARLDVPGM